jgi:hypothetical protein
LRSVDLVVGMVALVERRWIRPYGQDATDVAAARQVPHGLTVVVVAVHHDAT